MQQFTKPAIQIHISGPAMIQLRFAGCCVGLARTYRLAGQKADLLERLFSGIRLSRNNLPSDTTEGVPFSSWLSEKSLNYLTDMAKECWVAEVDDGTPVRVFPSQEAAEWFRDAVEAYHRLLPPNGDNGEWSTAQIEWFRNHPAPIVSACGGRLQVRQVGVH